MEATEQKSRISDNGNGSIGAIDCSPTRVQSLEKMVEYYRAEYFQCLHNLHSAHRGLERLAKRRNRYKNTAKACREAYKAGLNETKNTKTL